jgi:hypothetical protein
VSNSSENWQIEGEYFESCNCTVLCPCLLSQAQERPTEGHCDVVVAFHVNKGNYGTVDLSGLNAAIAIHTPGVMMQGKWSLATYVDERGAQAQRSALEAIFTGSAGGPLGRFGALVANRFPTKAAPISFTLDGNTRRLSIAGLSEVTIEGIPGAAKNGVVWFDNVFHFAARRLAAAKSSTSRYKDHSLSFDNSGRNGHFAPISWSNA